MKKIGLIYLCKNKLNGKIYIGQTIQTLEKRKRRHENDALNNNDNFIFHRALKKYEINNFEWSILESDIEEKYLNEKEKYFIQKYNSNNINIGYNMTVGGETKPTGNYILNNDLVLEIIDLIKTTNKSFKEIGNLYNVSLYAISDINRGKSWIQKAIDYPIRKTYRNSLNKDNRKRYNGALSYENIILIIKDLKDTYLTNTEIAKKYNTTKLAIASINNGRNLIARNTKNNFPIRKNKIDINNKILLNKVKIITDILDPTITYEFISKKYKISHITLQQINKGEVLFNSNLKYPLREKTISYNYQKKLTLENVNDIYELLEKTSLSFDKIAKFFNITKPCIRSINNGETWNYIKDDQIFPIRKQ